MHTFAVMLKQLLSNPKRMGFIVILFLTLLLSVIAANYVAVNVVSDELFTFLKFLFFTSFFLYAIIRKSLTMWILFALCLGVECGIDFPAISKEVKRFSDIFLRLIKTIVAPLIFGTLVVGIAGHSNLRQVGRMGLKAIIYFEIVTTLALFIGLAAINISEAGVGAEVKAEQTQIDKGEKILSQKKITTRSLIHSLRISLKLLLKVKFCR